MARVIGVVLGAVCGAGLFLIWWSCWPAQKRPPKTPVQQVTVIDRITDLLRQAGHDSLTARNLIAVVAVAFAATFLVMMAATRVWSVAVCFAVITGWLPVALVQSRARRRRASLRDLWPDAVDNIASAVRAGMALPEALSQLSVRGPVELRPSFAAFAQDYRTTGRFHDCLDRLKARLADPVGDRLVESLRIAREVGGSDLGRLLRTLSTFLREDARTRAELETRQGWTVNAARLACAAPWVVLAMLATRGESLAAYATASGTLVLVGGLAVTVVAYRVMMRLGRLPEDERVLR